MLATFGEVEPGLHAAASTQTPPSTAGKVKVLDKDRSAWTKRPLSLLIPRPLSCGGFPVWSMLLRCCLRLGT